MADDAAGGLNRRRLLRLSGALLAMASASGLLAACGSPPARPGPTAESISRAQVPNVAPAVASNDRVIRAAFVYPGPITDHAWTNAHDDGRKALVQALGSSVETAYTENVPATPDAQDVFESYARKGYDIVYGTGVGFGDYMLAAAASFPDVRFDHCSGSRIAPNMATYGAAEEEAGYVSGTIAGKMTRTNRLGFVGSVPIPEVIRFLNAFAVGVQVTNPQARILTVWIETGLDPSQEKASAESLLDLNADVLTGTTDSPAIAQAAGARGKYAVGVHYDQSSSAPQAILQSDRLLWGAHYINSVTSVMDGTWQPTQAYYHIKDGVVEPTRPSDFVPTEVAAAAMDATAQIKAGTLNVWKGPLVDNQGDVKAPDGKTLGDFLDPSTPPAAGQSADDAYVQSNQMNWALSNVVGDIPQSMVSSRAASPE